MGWGNNDSAYGSNRYGNDSTSTGYGNNQQHQKGNAYQDYGNWKQHDGGSQHNSNYLAGAIGLVMIAGLFYALFICQI